MPHEAPASLHQDALAVMMAPRSVAIIGASADFTRIGGRPIRFLLENGYPGAIYPVNPKYPDIAGLRCYPSILDVPGPVDVALVALPARMVPDCLDDCGRKGVRVAVVLSAGFAESGEEGRALQQEAVRRARAAGVRVLGPNTVGYAVIPSRLVASFASTWERSERLLDAEAAVSFVTQSGAFGAWILGMAQDRGFSFRHFVNVGNEADIDLAEVVDHILDDPRVRAVGAYMEGVRNGSRFVEMLGKARRLGKPLVLLKSGRSERAKQAALSHTGALAGDDKVYEALFREFGAIRADDVTELLDVLDLYRHEAVRNMPANPRLAMVTNSGGAGAWAADQCARLGITIASLSEATIQRLREILPPFASLLNPVDATAQLFNSPEILTQTMAILLDDPQVDVVYLLFGEQHQRGKVYAEQVAELARRSTKPILVGWLAGPPEIYPLLSRAGVGVFPDFLRPLRALGHIARWKGRGEESGSLALMRQHAAGASARGGGEANIDVLSEHEAKALLAQWGLPVPQGRLARTPEEVQARVREASVPVVLKLAVREVVHKTDAGLLALGITDPEEARDKAADILARAKNYFAPDRIAGILVEEMVPAGPELMVSLLSDPVFGPYLVVAAGGELVELMADSVVVRAGAPREHIAAELRRLRVYPLLAGYRSYPQGDVEALLDCLEACARFAADQGEALIQLELNPVRVLPRGQGVRVLDAVLIRRREGSPA